jgi:hypothetical protein
VAGLLWLAGCGAIGARQADRPVDPRAVTVFADRALGSAAQLGDFLGAGGNLAEERLVPPWRDLAFRHSLTEPIHTEGDGAWIMVSRDQDRIHVNFERYDRHLDRYRDVLGIARPIIVLGDIPRALSSQPDLEPGPDHITFGGNDYSAHMPRDLNEWRELVRTIVRHNVDRGLRGLVYGPPGEPDYAGRFRYSPADDVSTQLPNHIRLYVATYRAVKEVDPTARVGGPGTMSWRITPSTERAAFSLEAWIRALAWWNAENASEAAGLDFVTWQDYAWASGHLSDGADAVSEMLHRHGFDAATPKMVAVSGWGSWSSDYGRSNAEYLLARRASHIAHNLIREFRDPNRRRFALGLYYFFQTDDAWWVNDPATGEMFRRSAIVAFDLESREERTPMYAAFQMGGAMAEGGDIVQTLTPEPVEAMAVRDAAAGRVIVWMNKHTDGSVTVPVEIRDAPFRAATVRRLVRTIDEARSADGRGLKAGVSDVLPRADPLSLNVTLGPYWTVQVVLAR